MRRKRHRKAPTRAERYAASDARMVEQLKIGGWSEAEIAELERHVEEGLKEPQAVTTNIDVGFIDRGVAAMAVLSGVGIVLSQSIVADVMNPTLMAFGVGLVYGGASFPSFARRLQQAEQER